MKSKIYLILLLLILSQNSVVYCQTTADVVSFNTISTIETTNFPVIDIKSETGIGKITLTGLNHYVSKKLILRLHLGGLEHFMLNTKKICFKLSISTTSGKVFQTLSYTSRGLPVEINCENSMWFKVTQNVGDNFIELEIPPTVTQYFGQFVKISWIDFYR